MSTPAVEPVAVPDGARLVLATHNRKKLVELIAILRAQPGLADLPEGAVVTAGDLGAPEPVEDGVTFEENALPAVADDSGLAVDVLGGAPGIFSARWAGRHGDDQANLDLLLAQLSAIDKPVHRRAGFVCVAALVTPDGDELVERGEMRGTLVTEPRGANGFGYDPILVPDAQAPAADGGPGTRTSAELDPDEKNAISHRGEAFRALAPAIAAALR